MSFNNSSSGFFKWWLPPSGGGYDADAQLYFDELTGTVSDDVKTLVNNLVVTLKADNNWQYIDHLPLLNMPNEQNAMVNLKSPSDPLMVNYNSCVHTPYIGIQGNGTNAYIDTNYNPSTYVGAKYQLNSASLGIGVVDLGSVLKYQASMGGAASSGIAITSLTSTSISINDITESAIASGGVGNKLLKRVNSSTREFYQDGVSIVNQSVNSTNVTNSLILFSFSGLIGGFYSDCQLTHSITGSGLIDPESFNDAITTFVNAMAAL
jgi:hypothetical protein